MLENLSTIELIETVIEDLDAWAEGDEAFVFGSDDRDNAGAMSTLLGVALDRIKGKVEE